MHSIRILSVAILLLFFSCSPYWILTPCPSEAGCLVCLCVFSGYHGFTVSRGVDPAGSAPRVNKRVQNLFLEVRSLNSYVSPYYSTGRISTGRYDYYSAYNNPVQQPAAARSPSTLTTETDWRSVLEYNKQL
ncbi:hypothetical protein F511_34347 [Dorcoceras hygrometricum]|uniref:Uncharacterized protein n=1 Tax=Dorcoceras hygrometricum TaxID=472368 RepID=A0A2Z7AKS5_9LAMI|nr:hypothetical protein F511_34347 [Dorcoceras hygrometricum]